MLTSMVRSSTTTSSLQMRCRISSREKIVPRWAMQQSQDLELLLGERDLLAAERADLAPEVHLRALRTRCGLRPAAPRRCVAARCARGPAPRARRRVWRCSRRPRGSSPATVSSSLSRAVQKITGIFAVSGFVLQHLRHPESADFAHHHVEQDERIAFGVHPEGLFGAVRHIHFVTFDLEIELQNFAQRLFVVHHQNLVFCHSCRSLRIGFAPKLRNIRRCCMPCVDF